MRLHDRQFSILPEAKRHCDLRPYFLDTSPDKHMDSSEGQLSSEPILFCQILGVSVLAWLNQFMMGLSMECLLCGPLRRMKKPLREWLWNVSSWECQRCPGGVYRFVRASTLGQAKWAIWFSWRLAGSFDKRKLKGNVSGRRLFINMYVPILNVEMRQSSVWGSPMGDLWWYAHFISFASCVKWEL